MKNYKYIVLIGILSVLSVLWYFFTSGGAKMILKQQTNYKATNIKEVGIFPFSNGKDLEWYVLSYTLDGKKCRSEIAIQRHIFYWDVADSYELLECK